MDIVFTVLAVYVLAGMFIRLGGKEPTWREYFCWIFGWPIMLWKEQQ